MKRCEREWTPERAAGVQAQVRAVCGFCPCEQGIPCPLFPSKVPAKSDSEENWVRNKVQTA